MLSVPNCANRVGHCLGFGFDSIENDYKILWIVTKVVRDLSGFIVSMNLKPEAQLYSANADTWKKIRIPDTIRISFWNRLKRSCGPDISGKLYLEGEGGLLPFDLRNDVFRDIVVLPFLDYVEQKRIKKSKILDFEGSLAIWYMNLPRMHISVLSLWMLDDAGLWIKKFNLEIDLELDRMYLYLGAQHFLGLNFVTNFTTIERKRLRSFLSQLISLMSSLLPSSLRALSLLRGLNHKREVRFCGPDISGKLYLESEAGLLPFDLRNDVFREIVVLPFPIYGQTE
ncbi:hypothetical protein ACET3Z_029576 [Daucus carota]